MDKINNYYLGTINNRYYNPINSRQKNNNIINKINEMGNDLNQIGYPAKIVNEEENQMNKNISNRNIRSRSSKKKTNAQKTNLTINNNNLIYSYDPNKIQKKIKQYKTVNKNIELNELNEFEISKTKNNFYYDTHTPKKTNSGKMRYLLFIKY